jgi:hypothetical protein
VEWTFLGGSVRQIVRLGLREGENALTPGDEITVTMMPAADGKERPRSVLAPPVTRDPRPKGDKPRISFAEVRGPARESCPIRSRNETGGFVSIPSWESFRHHVRVRNVRSAERLIQ